MQPIQTRAAARRVSRLGPQATVESCNLYMPEVEPNLKFVRLHRSFLSLATRVLIRAK